MINDKWFQKDSPKYRYQNNLESIKGSTFVFDYVHLLYLKCHKINPSRGGSYTDSPDWIKNEKTTINPAKKKKQMFSIRTKSHVKSGKK